MNTSQYSRWISKIEAFYPSTKFKVVERAVKYFAKDLSADQNKTINECLKMIKFGMSNTLITYRDKYYEYDGDEEISNKCLTPIGGYESA